MRGDRGREERPVEDLPQHGAWAMGRGAMDRGLAYSGGMPIDLSEGLLAARHPRQQGGPWNASIAAGVAGP